MKSIKFLFSALCALSLLAACEKEEQPTPQEPEPPTNAMTYVGTIEVDQNDGTTFTKESIEVAYEINEEGKMNIVMYQVKFAEAMPLTLDMTIESVEYTTSDNGYALTGNNIVPIAMGGPFEQFMITNLTGEATKEGLTLNFTCGAYPVSYQGSAK